MNRLLVLAGAAVIALLLVHRPPAPAGVITSASPTASQVFRKGHPAAPSAQRVVVYVVGAVRRPGLYAMGAGARVNDAVVRAGGLLAGADAAAINLAQRVSDGEEIRVLRMGEASPAPARRSRTRKAFSNPQAAAIDLNAADAATLASLPGIGATLAARIVEYRSVNGPFASLDELADVGGMTQRRVDAVSPYLTLRAAR